jgi:hypothetical protein
VLVLVSALATRGALDAPSRLAEPYQRERR